MSNPKRGEIWKVKLDEDVERSALVISPYEMSKTTGLMITLVVTEKRPEGLPLWVGLGNERWVRCEIVHTMRIDRAVSFVERVTPEAMFLVNDKLRLILSMDEDT